MNSRFVVAAACALLCACVGAARLDPAPDELLGTWTGEARIMTSWASSQPLPVTVSIARDGCVEGRIGGASLREGYLASNRGAVGRKLGIKTDFVVRGSLEGTVVAGEPVASRVVFVPVDVVRSPGRAPELRGGVTTCRSAHGGGKDMAVCAGDLVLRR